MLPYCQLVSGATAAGDFLPAVNSCPSGAGLYAIPLFGTTISRAVRPISWHLNSEFGAAKLRPSNAGKWIGTATGFRGTFVVSMLSLGAARFPPALPRQRRERSPCVGSALAYRPSRSSSPVFCSGAADPARLDQHPTDRPRRSARARRG